jgi:hypothetical protein
MVLQVTRMKAAMRAIRELRRITVAGERVDEKWYRLNHINMKIEKSEQSCNKQNKSIARALPSCITNVMRVHQSSFFI